MKSTVSLIFEDLKFKISEGYDQFWSEPSEILNLRSSTTPETVAFTPPWYQTCTMTSYRKYHSSTPVLKVGRLLDALQNYSAVNCIKNSFTKVILWLIALNIRIFYYWNNIDESKSIQCFNALELFCIQCFIIVWYT